MKKYLSLLLAVLMTASLLAGCGGDTAADDSAADDTASAETGDTAASTGSGVELKFTTGGDQGTYYGFGTVLAQYVTSNTGSKVTAVVSNGSQDNIEQMDLNTAQLGFVQSDVMSYAYNGERLFEGMAVTGFSTVAALYMEQVQIVTCDPSIQSVADLAGKNVSIGASGSGVYYNALDVLADRNVWMDTSSCMQEIDDDTLRAILRRHPRERLVFGTDYPIMDPQDEIDALQRRTRFTDSELDELLMNGSAMLFS